MITEGGYYQENTPVLIGELTVKTGLKGFHAAEIGHPVFEVNDRYVIFLKSENPISDRVFNKQSNSYESQLYYYDIAVPYYKKTLLPHIKLTTI